MGALETAKEVFQLVRKLDNVELVQKVIELQSQVLALQEVNHELLKENETLRDQSDIEKNLKFRHNAWWLKLEGRHPGPYCVSCWGAHKKLIALKVLANGIGRCDHCGTGTSVEVSTPDIRALG